MAGRNELVFAPLGGIGEIGMNISIYGFGEEWRKRNFRRSLFIPHFVPDI